MVTHLANHRQNHQSCYHRQNQHQNHHPQNHDFDDDFLEDDFDDDFSIYQNHHPENHDFDDDFLDGIKIIIKIIIQKIMILMTIFWMMIFWYIKIIIDFLDDDFRMMIFYISVELTLKRPPLLAESPKTRGGLLRLLPQSQKNRAFGAIFISIFSVFRDRYHVLNIKNNVLHVF